MDSLNGVQYLVSVFEMLIDGLNVKNDAFAGARIDQETGEQKSFSHFKQACCFCPRAEGDCSYCQLDLSAGTAFNHFGLVFEDKVKGGNSSGRVAKRTCLGDTRGQFYLVQ